MRQRLFLHARAKIHDLISRQTDQLTAEVIECRADLIFARGDDLGGGGRRRRAEVGDKVGDREVRFVADSGDNGDRRLADRARYFFLVESPQVFGRAATTADDQDVDEIACATFGKRGS